MKKINKLFTEIADKSLFEKYNTNNIEFKILDCKYLDSNQKFLDFVKVYLVFDMDRFKLIQNYQNICEPIDRISEIATYSGNKIPDEVRFRIDLIK